jgi:ATP-dependent RNA helicase RhlE
LTFSQLALDEPILKALESAGYTTPTPIQEQAIPVVLQGKDLLGCAQTGTGKTAAFAIPILQLLGRKKALDNNRKHIRALILTPTRELAAQIADSFTTYGKNTGLKHTAIFGGVSQYNQVQVLRNGLDILIATPGRLLDLMTQRIISIQDIEMFVLDEADRMLDMGFITDVKKIIAKLPRNRQTLFFSATMPDEIANLANNILMNPVEVSVTPVSSTVEKIQQVVYSVDKGDKKSLLIHLLKDASIETALVFTRTKHGADKITKELNKSNIRAEAIHGNKSQAARQKALSNFKQKHIRILVATDIAARGIDIHSLSHVFNYDLPETPETYVHRIGRTGRAGAEGKAIAFCDREERVYLRQIISLIAQKIPEVTDHPFYVEPVMIADSGVKKMTKNVFSNNRRTFRQPMMR